ncbi:hypothetical protein EJ03DRAFT_325393 [Teratosphaeria nubilosa]|uniref:Uncharacterized protein n=1 Tax=Teratosphaeria nubilosa TaxID=161662 RepID=A0A6G1LHW6_9PEZI|nr:hypothetical protein EJ03DRAFT_325393 [Teratosphaeria nubilosa]
MGGPDTVTRQSVAEKATARHCTAPSTPDSPKWKTPSSALTPVIDVSALVGALDSGHVASVGLDVFEGEPKICIEIL